MVLHTWKRFSRNSSLIWMAAFFSCSNLYKNIIMLLKNMVVVSKMYLYCFKFVQYRANRFYKKPFFMLFYVKYFSTGFNPDSENRFKIEFVDTSYSVYRFCELINSRILWSLWFEKDGNCTMSLLHLVSNFHHRVSFYRNSRCTLYDARQKNHETLCIPPYTNRQYPLSVSIWCALWKTNRCKKHCARPPQSQHHMR